MPLYEYQCDSCGERFERIQKFSDPPVDVCPKCGSAVRKLFSSPAIQFKGTGFYITDYTKKTGVPSESGSSGDSKGDSKSDTKSETKSESKTETKSESKTDKAETKAPPKASE
jgi:putative FmdB family regulatory protein